MPTITLQVVEGSDKGRVYRQVTTPITIGREEGNLVRLNDERVSRYHSKIHFENDEVFIADLESTNGTRLNGNPIHLHRLLAGDRIEIGHSMLIFGSEAEINARITNLSPSTTDNPVRKTITKTEDELFAPDQPGTEPEGALLFGQRPLPLLPLKMTPSQAARTAELLDLLHRQVTQATQNIQANDAGDEIKLPHTDWQRILILRAILLRYKQCVGELDLLRD